MAAKDQGQNGGRAVPIISLVDRRPTTDNEEDSDRRQLKLDNQVTREILKKAGDYPVTVISIAGASRGGKSLMMSYVVRYLTALEAAQQDGTGAEEAGDVDWMEKERPEVSMKERGFKFENGCEQVTEGIWMWSRPFIISQKGRKVAILVMDTEGCFGAYSSEGDQSAIIGVSLLSSSCFIFNESSKIDENTLNTLGKFMEYGKLAISGESPIHKFQRLMFLVRDWTMPESYEYGGAGGKSYINEKILKSTSRMSKRAVEIRKSIVESFEDVDCYLMPYPGENVLKKDFGGSIGEMSDEFRNHVESFVTSLIEDVSPKEIQTPLFFNLLSHFVDEFNSNARPSSASIKEITTKILLMSTVLQLQKKYETEFRKELQTKPFVLPPEFEYIHGIHKRIVMMEFSSKKYGGNSPSEEVTAVFLSNLENEIEKLRTNILEERVNILNSAIEAFIYKFDFCMKEELMMRRLEYELEYETEFEAATLSAQKEGLEKFRVALDNDPPDTFMEFIQPTLMEKLQTVKDGHWMDLENRRQQLNQQVEKMMEEPKSSYIDSMKEIVKPNTNDYVLPGFIQSQHSAYEKIAAKLFEMEFKNQNLDFPPNSVASFVQQFKTQLNQELHNLLHKNEEQRKSLEEEIEKEISDTVELFNEESEKILQNPESRDPIDVPNYLQTMHTDMLDCGRDALNDHKLLDKGLNDMNKAYLAKWERTLKECLEKSLKDFESCEQHKEIQLNNIFQKSQQQFSQQVQSIFQQEEENLNSSYVEPSDLTQKLEQVVNFTRQQFQEGAEKLQSEKFSIYQEEFQTALEKEKEKVIRENQSNMSSSNERARQVVENCRQMYLNTVHKNLKQVEDITEEDLHTLHNSSLQEADENLKTELIKIKSSSFYPSMSKTLFEQFEEEHEKIKTSHQQQKMFYQDFFNSSKTKYKNGMENFLSKSPFYNDYDYSLTHDQLWNEIHGDFLSKIPGDIIKKRQKKMLKTLKEDFSPIFQEMETTAKTQKENALIDAEKLVESCLLYFYQQSKTVNESESKSTMSQLQENFQQVRQLTENMFEDGWKFPAGQQKDQHFLKLKQKIVQNLSTLESEMEEQKNVIQKIETVVLTAFNSGCVEIESQLGAGKLFLNSELEETLTKIEEEAIKILHEEIDKSTKHNSKKSILLADLTETMKNKLKELQNKNEENLERLKTKANKISTSLLNEMKVMLKNQTSFERETQNIVVQTLEKIKQEFQVDFTSFPELEQEISNNVEATSKSILSHFPKENDEVLIKKAKKLYSAEMKNHLGGEISVHPDNLTSFHELTVKFVTIKLEASSFLFEDQLDLIFDQLDKSFFPIEQKNNLYHVHKDNLAVGIDLGTTTSVVAVFQNGKPRVLKDNSGQNLIPSYVFYPDPTMAGATTTTTPATPIVGHEAKNQAHIYPERTVFDSKRLIGRPFSDPVVQGDIKTWPFAVTGDALDRPKIVIGTTQLDPEEVSAQILIRMKKIATDVLSKEVKKAVITVPASFNDRQREATRQAAVVAGLEVLQIINEPTAAAMAYALNWKDEEKIFLVFDFGGGTFDVSILKTGVGRNPSKPDKSGSKDASSSSSASIIPAKKAGEETTMGTNIEVLATMGDTHLGGEDFDSNMIELLASEFETEENVPLLEDDSGSKTSQTVKRRLRRLRNECEKVKILLTEADSATARLDAIHGSLDLNVTITKAKFEEMNEHLFKRSIDMVRRALESAGIDKSQVDDVIMVGGSSRIPRVKQLLQEFFNRPTLSIGQQIDIQEAVALGAAVQACILNGGSSVGKLPKIKDVQPFSLGIEVKENGVEGIMSKIIERNTPIPCEACEEYVTSEKDQQEARIVIYSGEEKFVKKNEKLGEFMLKGVPPGRAGSQKIKVKMNINESGILTVTGTAVGSGSSQNLTIEENRGLLSKVQVDKMKRRAQGLYP